MTVLLCLNVADPATCIPSNSVLTLVSSESSLIIQFILLPHQYWKILKFWLWISSPKPRTNVSSSAGRRVRSSSAMTRSRSCVPEASTCTMRKASATWTASTTWLTVNTHQLLLTCTSMAAVQIRKFEVLFLRTLQTALRCWHQWFNDSNTAGISGRQKCGKRWLLR